nr:hypothetical protein K09F6.1 - Caenorhabditis elegans [Caenorhabditis elegans]
MKLIRKYHMIPYENGSAYESAKRFLSASDVDPTTKCRFYQDVLYRIRNHPELPIVTDELFDVVQENLQQQNDNQKRNVKLERRNLKYEAIPEKRESYQEKDYRNPPVYKAENEQLFDDVPNHNDGINHLKPLKNVYIKEEPEDEDYHMEYEKIPKINMEQNNVNELFTEPQKNTPGKMKTSKNEKKDGTLSRPKKKSVVKVEAKTESDQEIEEPDEDMQAAPPRKPEEKTEEITPVSIKKRSFQQDATKNLNKRQKFDLKRGKSMNNVKPRKLYKMQLEEDEEDEEPMVDETPQNTEISIKKRPVQQDSTKNLNKRQKFDLKRRKNMSRVRPPFFLFFQISKCPGDRRCGV